MADTTTKCLLSLALAFFCLASQANPLSPAQQVTVRVFACADVATARAYVLAGDSGSLLDWLNGAVGYVVWRTRVTNDELGDAMAGGDLIGLSSLNMQRLQVLSAYSGGEQNMARADRRAAFDGVFSGAGGAITRASMAIVWKRIANRAEQALSSGLGTTISPSLTTYEGTVPENSVGSMLYTGSGVLIGC